MLTTNKQRTEEVYKHVKTFHNLEVLPEDIPNPQNINLIPTLRPYQVKSVKWMLFKEVHPSLYQNSQGNNSTEPVILLPKGGILADEMGLGKTVEVLACILTNPRDMKNDVKFLMKPEMEESTKAIKKETMFTGTTYDLTNDEIRTEDATVEVKTEGIKEESEDLRYGLGSMNDSGCVTDYTLSASGLQDEVLEESTPVGTKRKMRKTVTFDVDSVTDEPVTKRRKKNTDLCEIQTSSMDVTIEEVIQKHCHDNKPPQRRAKRQAAEKVKNYTLLEAWYNDCLAEMSTRKSRNRTHNDSTFQCCCIDDCTSDNNVQCPRCHTWQHTDCVGYDEASANYQYYCFRCWQHEPPVPSACTVIISPEAISQQWITEIEKHVKKGKLRVLVYEGVRVTGYIQPHDLAAYDIVITTYEVLSKELNYSESVKRSLRHAKRYYAPTSPLLFVQWWRLCLDEAQMVEGSSCRAAEMAKRFTAINKWAVTGTPIQKAVNDLVGLMEFLAGKECPEFLAEIKKDWRSLLKLVPRMLWRTQLKDVLEETGVPPQTVETHLLDFSKIEGYFYKCTHKECSRQFIDKITKFVDLNMPLKSLDRKDMSCLLNPLLKLRQACLHPQAVRGKFVSFKETMKMEDLVAQMITNAKTDAEQALRLLVAALNGAGALHIIREEWVDAVESYRGVLHLEQEYNNRLKIDSLQRIHTMHNLAEVLDGKYHGIPPTLRDGTLRDDIRALERRYLGNREKPIATTEERVAKHAEAIETQLNGATIGYSGWWMEVMELSTDRDELLDRVKAAIRLTDDKQKNQYNNLANKLKSLYIVRVELAQWLAEVDRVRDEVRQWVRNLRAADVDVMATEALMCHLPQAVAIKRRPRCSLCLAESELKNYEALIFEEKSKEKRKNQKRNLPGSSDWGDDQDVDREVADLVDVNVNTFESSKKGGFKASPFEKILRALLVYGRSKHVPSTVMKDGNQHLSLLDKLKKEFLDLNLMWREIYDLVDAKDELNMCKSRLRLPYPEEEEELQRNKKKKKTDENLQIIALYRVEPELQKFKQEQKQHEAMLKKKIGTLCYLETLEKEGSTVSICPICRNELTDRWSVLDCGHCLCLDCLSLVIRPLMVTLTCPQCRQPCKVANLSYVESEPSFSQAKDVKTSYSTKVDAVISQALRLTLKQPDVKILVFSAWEKVLDVLSEAFEENGITYRRMKSGKLKKRQQIKEFKTGPVSVLMLPLHCGAKGLNLVEATHVFLVEPILNPAEELQAVGRVHRIGQTKPTVVHRFIVRETIEERILAAVATSGAEQWSDDCITLQQLFDLFSCDVDMSLSQPEPEPTVIISDSESSDEEPELDNSQAMDNPRRNSDASDSDSIYFNDTSDID